MTQQAEFETNYSDERVFFRLSMFFGILAALLVATGLYGTLSYTMSRRTSEVGLRMALGAQRGQVLWMVLRGSLAMTIVGIAIGLPLALFATKLLQVHVVRRGAPRSRRRSPERWPASPIGLADRQPHSRSPRRLGRPHGGAARRIVDSVTEL